MSTVVASNLQASGGTGTTALLASINGGPLAGFRNRIINGNFDIWQRGTSFTAGGYGADRWRYLLVGTTISAERQSFSLGQTDVPGEPTYFCRTVVTSAAGANNYAILQQRIESVRTFAGQQVTVSFWAKADASKPIAVELNQNFGTGGSPSAFVNAIGVTKTTLSTSWQKVTVTATIPSISGKTIGSNGDDFLSLSIWFDAGSSVNARTDSLGQQSGTFDIAQVQLEPGPAATPFERRSYGQELILAKRYYEQFTSGIIGAGFTATAYVGNWVAFSVEKRAAPTLGVGTPSENSNFTSTYLSTVSTTHFRYYGDVTAAGNAFITRLITASAEL